MTDEIWEHKKGRVWILVEKLTRENRSLRYQIAVLQARVRRLSDVLPPDRETVS